MASAAIAPTSDKVYACPTCSRVFNKKANLKVHSRKHTGEKPYACSRPGCNRRFMWKSSVTFHEQNCPSLKRDHAQIHAGASPASPAYLPAETPPKRPKVSASAALAPSATAALAPDLYAGPTQPHHPQYYSPQQVLAAQLAQAPPSVSRVPTAATASAIAPPASVQISTDPSAHPSQELPTTPTTPSESPQRVTSSTSESGDRPGVSQLQPYAQTQLSQAARPPSAPAKNFQQTAPLGVEQNFSTYAESPSLPAPSTILNETKKVASGGRPPVIPSSLPKPYYSSKGAAAPLEQGTSTQRALFDLKVGGKPFGAKMPKMPIAMDLDDSDDEGPVRIVGAQDAFMRTGNPFGGFAPPTRCSPLPASSPIVIGVSPMPLSPLAPFSPLPPDSPAHNAPNPVHPPINNHQRPSTPNF